MDYDQVFVVFGRGDKKATDFKGLNDCLEYLEKTKGRKEFFINFVIIILFIVIFK